MVGSDECAYFLHDSRFALREGDVTARLVLDEFDIDLPPLTTSSLVIVVIFIRCSAYSRTFDTTCVGAIARRVVVSWRGIRISDVSHVRKGRNGATGLVAVHDGLSLWPVQVPNGDSGVVEEWIHRITVLGLELWCLSKAEWFDCCWRRRATDSLKGEGEEGGIRKGQDRHAKPSRS